eukprot:SAG11_NODE_1852_length_4166_cov_156.696090_1_plen_190_part_10
MYASPYHSANQTKDLPLNWFNFFLGCEMYDKARRTLPDGVSNEMVVEVLDHIKFPKQERLNISPDAVEGICLGISDGRGHGIGVAGESLDRPNLTEFLVRFAGDNLPSFTPENGEKGFQYTCIQINKNPPQNCHIDKNNEGPSYIIGLGDYAHTAQDCYGGWLWIQGRGPVDIKNKWVKFDGNIPHGTIG